MRKFFVLLLCLVLILAVGCKDKKESRVADGSIVFTQENLPRITATPNTVEMALSYVSAILGFDADATIITVCDTTDECYVKLINNECDIVVAHGFGSIAEQALSTTALKFSSTEVKQDALVFLTNGRQKVDSVSLEQLIALFSGQTSDWSAIGGEAMPVVPFGQRAGSAVQNAFEKYIGQDVKINNVISTVVTNKGEFKAELSYDNRDGGLGYALFSQCNHLLGNGFVSLKIDGVEPTEDNVNTGKYTLKAPVLVNIRASEVSNSNVRLLYEWMISEQGLKCVG